LELNSIPVADVALDNWSLGETPCLGVEVAAGDHFVVFSTSSARRALQVHCAENEDKTIAVRIP
jgi:hypothetical protein